MEGKKIVCSETTIDTEKYESIYEDYLNQPQGDLDDYIFGTETEQKRHSEK